MSYFGVHTTAGLEALYASLETGDPVTITEIAVGDGGGSEITPSQTDINLTNEVYRAAVNRIFRPDPTNSPTLFAAEMIIPVEVGGFTLREVGAFDANGDMLVIGSLPETYKPEAADGSFGETLIRLYFQALNADQIALTVNGALATQAWVLQAVNASTIIPGGTTNQVLAKQSNADGDTVWIDPTQANVVVDVIEERQLLNAGQTDVTLTVCTTSNLAIYIDGQRVPNLNIVDGWQDDPADDTHVILGQSYPQDTELIAVQNEPTGNLDGFLRKEKNLSDLPSKSTARTNLQVPSLAQMNDLVPPGALMDFAMSAAPSGWLECDGREVDRTTYAKLFNAIGTEWGAGNGVDTFNLPDFRGEFRRGWDHGRGIDEGRGFGSKQADALKSHTHTVKLNTNNSGGGIPSMETGVAGSPILRDFESQATGGTETRPRNIAVLTCIKA